MSSFCMSDSDSADELEEIQLNSESHKVFKKFIYGSANDPGPLLNADFNYRRRLSFSPIPRWRNLGDLGKAIVSVLPIAKEAICQWCDSAYKSPCRCWHYAPNVQQALPSRKDCSVQTSPEHSKLIYDNNTNRKRPQEKPQAKVHFAPETAEKCTEFLKASKQISYNEYLTQPSTFKHKSEDRGQIILPMYQELITCSTPVCSNWFPERNQDINAYQLPQDLYYFDALGYQTPPSPAPATPDIFNLNPFIELPQYGHKQWHSHFGRTFDVYTKLWKFQQQHRAILDSKYGLKRWQIGEIASKIGQLYYHFYLRTSETAYLNEAFSFYYAIRGRCYYTKACKEDKCELMVKKLRYYARFIVVCLLLKKIKLVRELIKELDRQIIEYGNTYDPDDQMEWTVVVDEVKAFIQAEPVISVIHPDNHPVILSHRLSSLTTPPVERSPQMSLSLQEVLIIGSSSLQAKFSELTIDMFRMLQTLEREPSGEPQHMYDDSPRQRFISNPTVPTNKGYNLENGPRRDSPHKFLLFKPSPSQVLVYLASGCNDLPPSGALLLYISADGQIVPAPKHPEEMGYEVGGLITTSRSDIHRDCAKDPKGAAPSNIPAPKYKEQQCLHPGDLYPFTRRPLFIIIDSDNSYVFQHIPRHFGQPLVILMSPLDVPQPFQDSKQQGNLFTIFLTTPLTAFAYICDIHNLSLSHWDRAQGFIDTFMAEASQILTRSRIDIMYIMFMGDDYLRLLLLRFVFCEVTLRLHRAFRSRTQLTRASPPLPEEILDHPTLIHIVLDLALNLQARNHFHDPGSAGPSQVKE